MHRHYPLYAEMIAAMLTSKGGHEVLAETVPLSLETIRHFDPDVIVINMVRKMETITAGGMSDFYTDVEGAKALREVTRALEDGTLDRPVILTSLAVLEHELPTDLTLDYVAFIEVPQQLDRLVVVIDKVIAAQEGGAKLIPE